MSAEVTVETTGEAEGVKTAGGVLESHPARRWRSNVSRPTCPNRSLVDISGLNIGDAVHVQQISSCPKV